MVGDIDFTCSADRYARGCGKGSGRRVGTHDLSHKHAGRVELIDSELSFVANVDAAGGVDRDAREATKAADSRAGDLFEEHSFGVELVDHLYGLPHFAEFHHSVDVAD